MIQLCKKMGFVLLVLIISAGFYWFLFMDKGAQQDVLTYTLDLLGKQFIELISDDIGRRSVQALYRDFVEKARLRQVPPQNIEYVTANILNLSNRGENITPEQAAALLKNSLAAPVIIDTKRPDSTCDVIITPESPPLPQLPPSIEIISNEQWDKLAIKIKTLYDFNSEMQHALNDIPQHRPELHHYMKFTMNKNIKITMDSTIIQEIYKKDVPKLHKEIEQLKKIKLLVWHKNFINN